MPPAPAGGVSLIAVELRELDLKRLKRKSGRKTIK